MEHHYKHAQGAVLMFDMDTRMSYTQTPFLYRDIKRYCCGCGGGGGGGTIPTVLVGNKADVVNPITGKTKIKGYLVTYHQKKNLLGFYETSAKTGANIAEPFLCLARKLVGDPGLVFVGEPACFVGGAAGGRSEEGKKG